ncbi:MAG: hypothetical protein AMJ41_04115 [candidate division Zixibacteria bacterium DG_27]|nr:MAG: hypothetical protein AMJ41_04115 [candidate division Zixibacteria bacterium DG_27]
MNFSFKTDSISFPSKRQTNLPAEQAPQQHKTIAARLVHWQNIPIAQIYVSSRKNQQFLDSSQAWASAEWAFFEHFPLDKLRR